MERSASYFVRQALGTNCAGFVEDVWNILSISGSFEDLFAKGELRGSLVGQHILQNYRSSNSENRTIYVAPGDIQDLRSKPQLPMTLMECARSPLNVHMEKEHKHARI